MTQAEIAQLVEHFTRNEGVVGSSPIFSLSMKKRKPKSFLFFVLIIQSHEKPRSAMPAFRQIYLAPLS